MEWEEINIYFHECVSEGLIKGENFEPVGKFLQDITFPVQNIPSI